MLEEYPNQVVDIHINIIQADAGTRCAGINAAAMALAHAGIPMKDLVSSVAVGKMDKTVVLDLDKYEDSEFEDGEGSTDIPISMTHSGKITHMQLDGKINLKQLNEAIDLAKEACDEIYEVQKKALKEGFAPLGVPQTTKGGSK
jgi:exosome complex component RRP41